MSFPASFPGPTASRLSITPAQLHALLQHRAVQLAATLVALLLLATSLAQWTWRLWPAAPAPISEPLANSSVDLAPLKTANPFGPSGAADDRPAPTDGLARTSLNLVLTGVMVGGRGGCALLSVDGGPESAYCAGEDILPGARLETVHGDRIVISRNGAREIVPLRELEGAGLAGLNVAPAPIVQSLAPDRRVVDRRQMQQQLTRPEFLSQALIVPNPGGGGGFLVREVQSGSLYEKLGLRPGDIIRNVNGQPLQNMEEVMRLYQQFGSAGRIVVDVQREGRTESLYFDMR